MVSQHQMSDQRQLEPVARLIQLPFWLVSMWSAYVWHHVPVNLTGLDTLEMFKKT